MCVLPQKSTQEKGVNKMSGVFQTSRGIFSSDIWNDVVKFRIFFYIYGNAVFSKEGIEQAGIKLKRGQYLRSLRGLQDDLSYKEGRGNAIKKYPLTTIQRKIKSLEKDGRITTKSTEYGTLFTVVNYELYQGFDNHKKELTEQQRNSDGTATEQRWNNNKNDNNKYIYTVFEHWRSKGIIAHKKLNKQMESHINARLQEYDLDEILKAIDNYHTVLTDDKYYWTYKWTLQDFMKPNNIVRFLDSSEPFVSFLKNKNDNVIRFERPEPSGRDIPRGFDYEKAKTAGEDPNW